MRKDKVLWWWTRHGILRSMKGQRFASQNAAILHFASLVPRGKCFGYGDVASVFDALNLPTFDLESELWNLCHQNESLIFDPVRKFWSSSRAAYSFRLDEKVRFQIESESRKGTAEPEHRTVSKTLEQLVAEITDVTERRFAEETLICLRAQACRAAIVMGWILAFHHIRCWILKNHLQQFNSELSKYPGKRLSPALNHDTFPESERLVLEICKAAKILIKKKFDILEPALKQRNQFAHPTSAQCNIPIASGYISNLLENVLCDPVFKI
jgi:hypothetical protein